MLHAVLREHVETFLASNVPPRHVRRALRGFLDRGLLARGFVRVRCPDGWQESPVAFSRKYRSFRPSCTGRRAADTAAHLVDEVLPHVPLRQWVLALPPDLRARVARDPELEGKLLAIFSSEFEQLLRATTRTGDLGRGGNVTLLQHFGSALNLHGNFTRSPSTASTSPAPRPTRRRSSFFASEPTTDQVRGLCERAATRARKLVARRSWREPAEERVLPVLKVFGAEPRPRVSSGSTHASTASTSTPRPRSRPRTGSRWSDSAATRCEGPLPTAG